MFGVSPGAHRDHQDAAPFRQRIEGREISIGHVVPAAAEIADLGLEGGDARRDLAADLAHAVDADPAAEHAGLRAHHRRRFCRRPAPAPHIVVGHQQPPRGRQHQGDRDIGDRSRIRTRAVTDRDVALGRRGEIDAVIAGAVADDGAELRHQVHRSAAERRAAGRDHRADVGELFGREHFIRRLAGGVEQFEALAEAHHLRLWKARIDQDLLGHCSSFFPSPCVRRDDYAKAPSNAKGGTGRPIPPLLIHVSAQRTSRAACPARP